LDVNLLIALYSPDHVHHPMAHEWWDAARAAGWASCPLTQNGFVRVLSRSTSPVIMPVAEALDRLREATDETNHEFWPDDVTLHDQSRFASDRIHGHKQLTDVYLLGLAVKNGGRLATLDRRISRAAVRGAEPQHLVVI
jgi:toxin-antitoxin system PIN domain toxin